MRFGSGGWIPASWLLIALLPLGCAEQPGTKSGGAEKAARGGPSSAGPTKSAGEVETGSRIEVGESGALAGGQSASQAGSPAAGSSAVEEPSGQQSVPLFVDWPKPAVVLVISGRQHGYIEPCGCTGLVNQKGGLARRHTLLRELADKGWNVVPLDSGDQVRRFGRQAEIKFQITVQGLKQMGYRVASLAGDDLRLSIDELAATTAPVDDQDTAFVSANVAILDREFTPRIKVLEVGGRRIGVTAVLGDAARATLSADELLSEPARDGLQAAWKELKKAECNYHVLIVQGTREESVALTRAVPYFDLVVTTGAGDEPTLIPEQVPSTKSIAIQVGAKSMYVAVVGLFDDPARPWRYERVPLDARFADSPAMLDLLAAYQQQLKRLGWDGLGVRPLAHPAGLRFVGSEACAECHSKAAEVWQKSRHHDATESLVHPSERAHIPRHFDPECICCHVTGWSAQRSVPYDSGYVGLEQTPHLQGVGCEDCHGPGSAHVAVENGEQPVDDAQRDMLREQMRLPLAEAEKKCMECHDLDNSPDFHSPGAFEEYWQQIVHPGKD